jgi:phosphoglycerate dehydrogenase-like enzyme
MAYQMNVTLAFDFGAEFVERLRVAHPTARITPAYTPAEQLALAPEMEVQLGRIDRDTFLAAPNLKWFHFVGIGFDIFLRQIPELLDGNVVMTNARGTHVIPMAEYAIGMMIALAHQLPRSVHEQTQRLWDTTSYRGHIGELAGTTLGILAFGEIGRAVASRAAAFDMRVYAVDLAPPDDSPVGVEAVWPIARLAEMLALSDWLVITAPRTRETEDLIGLNELQSMRPGAGVVVVSRGGILNEAGLVAALASGHIAGAALDVTASEPPPPDSPLWEHPQVLLTPHVSAESAQLQRRRQDIMNDNLGRYIAGEPLLNVCDLEKGY